MININMEVVFTSPSYVCGERRRALDEHARSPHLAGPDGEGWGEASRGVVNDAGA